MKRAVTVLEVAETAVWAELAAQVPLEEHLAEALGPIRRVVKPSFEKEVVPKLVAQGQRVLIRYARRDRAEVEASTHALEQIVAGLPADAQRVLASAQHHALDGIVLGAHAWDPEVDAASVRILHGAGLLDDIADEGHVPYAGRYRLNPDLRPAPPIPYDFSDAAMEETDDLEEAKPGPLGLLHDLASLAAAIEHVGPHRTQGGTLAKADGKRLGARLGADLDRGLEEDPRWARALRGLEALHVVSMDPFERALHLDLGLETTLSGDAAEAVDHLIHRMVERDLHGVVPAVREALRQAGEGALDELVFLEVLREQHRDVIFPMWRRKGLRVYPQIGDESPRAYDDEAFELVEVPMVRVLLSKLVRLGLIRRAPGVFAGTRDGRVWARVATLPSPPIWVTGDLEIVVPPDAITPWERYQLERLGRCLARDVVDRYRIERAGLEKWLSTHDLDEALDLLARRCPGVPTTVQDTLRTWAKTALRVVLVRGVVIEDEP